MKYIDIHCHINFPAYDADRAAVIARAQEAGVGMILIGNDKKTSLDAVDLAEKHKNMWACIGLHPTHIGEETIDGDFDYEFYKKLAQHPKVVGIGECGLDYFRSISESQEKVFRAHIKLAHEVNKPLVLHIRNGTLAPQTSRNAYRDVITILQDEKINKSHSQIGDVHFFAGGVEYARQFIDLGFSLSFTGVITFAEEYADVVRNIPLDRIMSETDSPFVTPVPFRGQRNEPLHVIHVATTIAAIRSEDPEKVRTQLVENARILFKI